MQEHIKRQALVVVLTMGVGLGSTCHNPAPPSPIAPPPRDTTPSAPPSPGTQWQDPPVVQFNNKKILSRTLLPDALVNSQSLEGYVGHVLRIPRAQGNPNCTITDSTLSSTTLTALPVVKSKAIETKPLGEVLYQSVVDKNAAAGIAYLANAINVSDSTRSEVILEDAAVQQVNPDSVDENALFTYESKRDTTKYCGFYLITKAFLTTVKHKEYTAVGADGKISGFAFSGNGKVYHSTLGFSSIPMLAIAGGTLESIVPAKPLVAAGIRTTLTIKERNSLNQWASTVRANLSIPDTIATVLPSVLHTGAHGFHQDSTAASNPPAPHRRPRPKARHSP